MRTKHKFKILTCIRRFRASKNFFFFLVKVFEKNVISHAGAGIDYGDQRAPKDYVQVKSVSLKLFTLLDCLLLWSRPHPEG